MTEPKLFTPAEAVDLWNSGNGETFLSALHERGLIAPEPDKREAAYQAYLDRLEPGFAGCDMKFVFYAGYDAAEYDLATLRRGMELTAKGGAA